MSLEVGQTLRSYLVHFAEHVRFGEVNELVRDVFSVDAESLSSRWLSIGYADPVGRSDLFDLDVRVTPRPHGFH